MKMHLTWPLVNQTETYVSKFESSSVLVFAQTEQNYNLHEAGMSGVFF